MKAIKLILILLTFSLSIFSQTINLSKNGGSSSGSGVDSITPVPLKTASTFDYAVVTDNDTLKNAVISDIDTTVFENLNTKKILITDNTGSDTTTLSSDGYYISLNSEDTLLFKTSTCKTIFGDETKSTNEDFLVYCDGNSTFRFLSQWNAYFEVKSTTSGVAARITAPNTGSDVSIGTNQRPNIITLNNSGHPDAIKVAGYGDLQINAQQLAVTNFTVNGNGVIGFSYHGDDNNIAYNCGKVEKYVIKSANYTATISDYTIEMTNATDTLFLPAGVTGQTFKIVNVSAGNVTIDGNGSEQIGNAITNLTYTLSTGNSIELTFNGTYWRIF